MIDHFSLPVSDIEKSLRLYQPILKILGYELLFQDQDAYGFGINHWQFGLYPEKLKIVPLHVAFQANSRAKVDLFYDVAINMGAKPNGEPGLRLEYGANYYACYVYDYDGHNVEAVCRLGG